MNGIWVKSKDGRVAALASYYAKVKERHVYVFEHGEVDAFERAEYQSEAARDRVCEMLENAIATGVRLFRFPTDAEVEGEEE